MVLRLHRLTIPAFKQVFRGLAPVQVDFPDQPVGVENRLRPGFGPIYRVTIPGFVAPKTNRPPSRPGGRAIMRVRSSDERLDFLPFRQKRRKKCAALIRLEHEVQVR